MSSSSTGGLAQVYGEAIAALPSSYITTATLASSEDGSLTKILRLSLATCNPAIFQALSDSVPKNVKNAYPWLILVAASGEKLGDHVAVEVMRSAGCKSFGNKPYLVDGLPGKVLRGFLVGKFPEIDWFGTSYSTFMQATVLGRQFTAVTIDYLFEDLTAFQSFIRFVIYFFGALCLDASRLQDIVSKAQTLSERAGPVHGKSVLSTVVPKAFKQTMDNFERSLKAWNQTMNPTARKPPPLMPVLAEMNEAGEAISEIQAQDMSAFGLPGRSYCNYGGAAEQGTGDYSPKKSKREHKNIPDVSSGHELTSPELSYDGIIRNEKNNTGMNVLLTAIREHGHDLPKSDCLRHRVFGGCSVPSCTFKHDNAPFTDDQRLQFLKRTRDLILAGKATSAASLSAFVTHS